MAAAAAAAYCCWMAENRCAPVVHAPGNWAVLPFSDAAEEQPFGVFVSVCPEEQSAEEAAFIA